MISVFHNYFCIQINKVTILNNSAYNSLFYTGRAAERDVQNTGNPSFTSGIKKEKNLCHFTEERDQQCEASPAEGH